MKDCLDKNSAAMHHQAAVIDRQTDKIDHQSAAIGQLEKLQALVGQPDRKI